jgi:hypothetical protein
MSGAPVFFQYSKIQAGNKLDWITFGGVAFGMDTLFNSSYLVSPIITIREFFRPTIFNQ